MVNRTFHRRFPYTFILGVLLIILSCFLLFAHIRSLAIKKNTALSVGLALPALRTQVTLLKATVEAEKVTGTDMLAALEQQSAVTIFPQDQSTARFARTVPVLISAIDAGRQQLVFDQLQFAPTPVTFDSHVERTATVSLRGSLRDVSQFLSLLELQGTLTIADVLGPKVSADFLRQVEKNSPASLAAASSFLLMDILRYSLDPQAAEKTVLQDMDTTTAADVHTLLLSGGLSTVRSMLSPVASKIKTERVWPLPLASIDSVSEKNGAWVITFRLLTRHPSTPLRLTE